MNKSYFLWFSVLVLLVVFVSGVPPVQTTSTITDTIRGLKIFYPERDNFKVNSNFTLYFHIANSNGSEIKNNSIYCRFHLYNKSNAHIQVDNLSFDVEEQEWKIRINSSVLNSGVGFYPYLVGCNSSIGESGVVSNGFFVTFSGETNYLSNNMGVFLAVALMLLPLLFGFLLIRWVDSLGDAHTAIKLSGSILGLLMFPLSLWFGFVGVGRYTFWVEMLDALPVVMRIVFWVLMAFVAYFFIYGFVNVISNIGGRKGKGERFDY